MPQIGKIEKSGDFFMLRLPPQCAEHLGLDEGDEVVINLVQDHLEIGHTAHRRLLAVETGRRLSARYRNVIANRG
ncbi:hypothetical protein AAU61_02030 [Desulfocarbo indianensis]|nr:hypothetical protein AAU61_02030 [Desulfocarbo indianensis]